MRKIIGYKVLHISLQKNELNFLLEDGWQPYGEPFTKHWDTYQAMVKYEETESQQAQPKVLHRITLGDNGKALCACGLTGNTNEMNNHISMCDINSIQND